MSPGNRTHPHPPTIDHHGALPGGPAEPRDLPGARRRTSSSSTPCTVSWVMNPSSSACRHTMRTGMGTPAAALPGMLRAAGWIVK